MANALYGSNMSQSPLKIPILSSVGTGFLLSASGAVASGEGRLNFTAAYHDVRRN
jgi:hypothetical protein